MKTATIPNVEELNRIQSAWMKLEHTAPKAEQDKVFKMMEQYPKAYLTISQDKTTANVVIGAGIAWPNSRATAAAVEWLKQCDAPGSRTDVAWCGSIGQWVSL